MAAGAELRIDPFTRRQVSLHTQSKRSWLGLSCAGSFPMATRWITASAVTGLLMDSAWHSV